jgi:hypothetical protein
MLVGIHKYVFEGTIPPGRIWVQVNNQIFTGRLMSDGEIERRQVAANGPESPGDELARNLRKRELLDKLDPEEFVGENYFNLFDAHAYSSAGLLSFSLFCRIRFDSVSAWGLGSPFLEELPE